MIVESLFVCLFVLLTCVVLCVCVRRVKIKMPKIQRRHKSTRSKVDEEEVPRSLPVFMPSVLSEASTASSSDAMDTEEASKKPTDPKGKLALKLALKEKHKLQREAFMNSSFLPFLSFRDLSSFFFTDCCCLCVTSFVLLGIPLTRASDGKKKQRKAERKKKKSSGTPIVMDELMQALNEDSATSTRKQTSLNKTAPKHFDRSKRAKMEAAEAAQFKSVFQMNAFQANPMDSIAQHIKNTVALGKM